MIDSDPTLRPDPQPGDIDRALRPQMLDEFVGQAEARANLKVFIQSAKQRGEAMDHTLFHGPPGLGKTTLAQIMARELGVGFRMTSGPVLAKAGDLAAILTNLEARDVLFIDEIHRLNPAVEEVLYPALEDFELDLVIGEGPAARTVRIELQPFTLVGATTRMGLLTTPLRDRFGIPTRLQFYTEDELFIIVDRNARKLGAQVTLQQGSWLEDCRGPFDVIVSNPPYIDPADHHLDEGDVRFEPRSALVADQRGLADLATIITQSAARLVAGGWLLLEHGYQQGAQVRALMEAGRFDGVRTERDLGGNERVTVGRQLIVNN